jgi:hypothetical protein
MHGFGLMNVPDAFAVNCLAIMKTQNVFANDC